MLLKHIKQNTQFVFRLKQLFAQPPKKRTQPPRFKNNKTKVDPKDIDYNRVPQYLRKGVKAHVEASNMLVTSEAQLEAMSLKQIILQERAKFLDTLQKTGQHSLSVQKQTQVQKQKINNQVNPSAQATKQTSKTINETQRNYDLLGALRYMSYISNSLMVANMTGYMMLYTFEKYQWLGFFLGASMNPSIIALTAMSIGFNCASWIIRQSLHLEIKDPKDLTLDKISLTGCSRLMYFDAVVIAIQSIGLSYYLISPNPYQNISFLIEAFIVSQGQSIYNIIRATNGYRFEYFSKLLITQIIGSILIGTFVYTLFRKIDKVNKNDNISSTDITEQNYLLKKGYNKFLSKFKTQDFQIFAGQKINKLTSETEE